MSEPQPPNPESSDNPPRHSVDLIEIVARESAEAPLPGPAKSEAEERALFRAEKTRDVVHWVVIWSLRSVGLTAIAVVVLRIIHLALPLHLQFISPEQQSHIDSMFLSGSVAVAISKHLKQVMGWEQNGKKGDGGEEAKD